MVDEEEEEDEAKCSYFRPKTSKGRKNQRDKEALCHCGESEENHLAAVADPSLSGRWSEEYIEEIPGKPFHGEIYFPLNDAADTRSRCIRLNSSDSMEQLIRFMTGEWNILKPRRPKLCVSLLTAHYKTRIAEDLKARIVSEIVETLKTCDAWLINNGLNVNFNFLVGKALSEVFTNYFGLDTPFVPPKAIGFCRWGSVKDRNSIQPFNERGESPKVYNWKSDNADGSTCSLLPFNSHIVFLDDGFRRTYNGDQFDVSRAFFEKLISAGTQDRGLGVPVVDLVIGGDLTTIYEVLQAVLYNTSVIVLKGSGYAADLIAYAYEIRINYKDKPFNEFSVNEKESLQKAAKNIMRLKKTSELANVLSKIMYSIELVAVFDVRESEGLASEIMNLMLAKATDIVGKLYLAQAWRNVTIAEDLIFKNHETIQTQELYELMLTALLNEQLDFVKLFLRMGLNLQDFLTVDRLHSLYNFSSNRNNLTANLRNANLDQDYFNVPVKDPEVATVISSKNYSVESGEVGSLRSAFIAFIGELTDKKVQTFVDALRVEEEERLKVINKKTVFLSTVAKLLGHDFESEIYSFDTPDHFSRTMMSKVRFREPADHLTIWALMHARQEMAMYFLSLSSQPVCLAIFAAGICRKISHRTPSYDTCNKALNLDYASELETDALRILDLCENTHSDTTTAMLIDYKPKWENPSLPVVAANCDCLQFVSSNAFQNMVTEMWENGVRLSFLQLISVIFCPLLLCCEGIPISPPLDTMLYKVRKNIKPEFLHDKLSVSDTEDPICCDLDIYAKDLDVSVTLPVKIKFRIFYKSPRVKYALFVLALFVYLLFFSYMLLFNLHVDYISWTEIIVMIYSTAWFIYDLVLFLTDREQELSMVIQTFPWLPAYFVADILFFVAAMCRIKLVDAFIITRYAYGLQLIVSYAKLFYLMMLSQYYGPKVVMISEMLRQLVNAVSILFIIMLGYGAAVQVLLYPTLDTYNWDQVIGIFYYPYFQLFGEMSFDYFNAEEPCNTTVETCPQSSVLVPILHAVYMLIAVLIFLNLLIAVFSNIFSDLNEKSREIWMVNRFRIVFCFDRASFLPMPFAAAFIYLPKLIADFCIYLSRCCLRTREGCLNGGQCTWETLMTNYKDSELGFNAHLHRFQEFCGHVYYKAKEKESAESFDTHLKTVNYRLKNIEAAHEEIKEYFEAAETARETGDASGILEFIESPWSRRLIALKKAIASSNKLFDEILDECKLPTAG